MKKKRNILAEYKPEEEYLELVQCSLCEEFMNKDILYHCSAAPHRCFKKQFCICNSQGTSCLQIHLKEHFDKFDYSFTR